MTHSPPSSGAPTNWRNSLAALSQSDRPVPPLGRLGLWLFGLVTLADWLFWSSTPGLSLVVFAAAILVAAVHLMPHSTAGPKAAALLAVSSLPVIEHVQPLSVAILGLGLVAALALLHGPSRMTAEDWAKAAAARLIFVPLAAPLLAQRLSDHPPVPRTQWRQTVQRLARNWAFPLGGALVLVVLLVDANPILSDAIDRLLAMLDPGQVALRDVLLRPLFWLGLGLMVIGLIIPAPDLLAPPLPKRPTMPSLGLNAHSALNALWTFNAVLLVQTAMDLWILLAGAALPEGMSYATYAHRGAYPLLITAVLAGGFALATKPYQQTHRALRPLLILWLGQNLLICGSAALRLDLYIGAYGVTYLRLYALIWMALTAAALLVIGWQVVRQHSVLWTLARLSGLGALTLYAACFVNFAAIIADTNLRLASRSTAPVALDLGYLADLGPMASGAIARHGPSLPDRDMARTLAALPKAKVPTRWPEWGFRTHRVARYVETVQERVQP